MIACTRHTQCIPIALMLLATVNAQCTRTLGSVVADVRIEIAELTDRGSCSGLCFQLWSTLRAAWDLIEPRMTQ